MSAKNHFELFGIPASFELDLDLLEQTYRNLQRNVHPDRFANATEQERRISMQLAAQTNDAYQTLKDPLSRARYCLELHGSRIDDEHNTTRDTAFLMQQMELREALGDVRGHADPLAALQKIMNQVVTELAELESRLGVLLVQDEAGLLVGSPDEGIDTVLKMKFYRRLQEEALDLEAALEDEQE